MNEDKDKKDIRKNEEAVASDEKEERECYPSTDDCGCCYVDPCCCSCVDVIPVYSCCC